MYDETGNQQFEKTGDGRCVVVGHGASTTDLVDGDVTGIVLRVLETVEHGMMDAWSTDSRITAAERHAVSEVRPSVLHLLLYLHSIAIMPRLARLRSATNQVQNI